MAFALVSKSSSKPQGSVKPVPQQQAARGLHSAEPRSGFAQSVCPPYGHQSVLQMRHGADGPPAPAVSWRPSQSGILQRKCACGGTAGMSGECEECSKQQRLGLQTKLTVNEPGDIYEQEADRIAEQVMAMPAHPTVSGAPPRIQRFAGQSHGQMEAAPASVDQVLASPGRPLEPALRRDMEQRFGHDFSRVRVHTGAAAEQSAQDVHAHAYTVGHNMVFGAGRFMSGTHEGRRLIAHELTHVVQQSGADGIHSVTSMLARRVQREARSAPGGGTKAVESQAGTSSFNSYADLFNAFQDLAAAAINRGGAGLDTVRFGRDLSPTHRSLLWRVRTVLIQAQERDRDVRVQAAAAWPALATKLLAAVEEARRLQLPAGPLAAVTDQVALLGRKYVHARRGKTEPELETSHDYADTVRGMNEVLWVFARMGEPGPGLVREEVPNRKDAVVSAAVREGYARQRAALMAVQFGGHLNKRHVRLLETLRTALILARSEAAGSAYRALTRWRSIQGELEYVLMRAPNFEVDLGPLQAAITDTAAVLANHYAQVHQDNLGVALTKERPREQAKAERMVAKSMGPRVAGAMRESRVIEDFRHALTVIEQHITPSPNRPGEWILTSGNTVIRIREDQVVSLRATAATQLKNYMAGLVTAMVDAWQTYDSIKQGNSSFKLRVLGGWGGATDPGDQEDTKNSLITVRDKIVYPLVDKGRFVDAFRMIIYQKGMVERHAHEVYEYDADLDRGYSRLARYMQVIQVALVALVPVAGELALGELALIGRTGVWAVGRVGGTAIAAGSGGAALAETGRQVVKRIWMGEDYDPGKIGSAAYSGGVIAAGAVVPAASRGLGKVFAAGGEGTTLAGANALASGFVGAFHSKLGGGGAIEGFVGNSLGSLAGSALGPVSQQPIINMGGAGGVGAFTAALSDGDPIAGFAGGIVSAAGGMVRQSRGGSGTRPPTPSGDAGKTLPGTGISPRPPATPSAGETLPGTGISPRSPATPSAGETLPGTGISPRSPATPGAGETLPGTGISPRSPATPGAAETLPGGGGSPTQRTPMRETRVYKPALKGRQFHTSETDLRAAVGPVLGRIRGPGAKSRRQLDELLAEVRKTDPQFADMLKRYYWGITNAKFIEDGMAYLWRQARDGNRTTAGQLEHNLGGGGGVNNFRNKAGLSPLDKFAEFREAVRDPRPLVDLTSASDFHGSHTHAFQQFLGDRLFGQGQGRAIRQRLAELEGPSKTIRKGEADEHEKPHWSRLWDEMLDADKATGQLNSPEVLGKILQEHLDFPRWDAPDPTWPSGDAGKTLPGPGISPRPPATPAPTGSGAGETLPAIVSAAEPPSPATSDVPVVSSPQKPASPPDPVVDPPEPRVRVGGFTRNPERVMPRGKPPVTVRGIRPPEPEEAASDATPTPVEDTPSGRVQSDLDEPDPVVVGGFTREPARAPEAETDVRVRGFERPAADEGPAPAPSNAAADEFDDQPTNPRITSQPPAPSPAPTSPTPTPDPTPPVPQERTVTGGFARERERVPVKPPVRVKGFGRKSVDEGASAPSDGVVRFNLASFAHPTGPGAPAVQVVNRQSPGTAGTQPDVPTVGKATGKVPNETFLLSHGTDNPGFRNMGGLGAGRIRVDHSPGARQDFGQGFYVAVGEGRSGVGNAEAFGDLRVAQRRSGPRQVLAWEVKRSDLGDVVDVRPGGEHEAAWRKYLEQPLAPNVTMTIGDYIRGTGVEHRGEYFERFLQSIGKQNADVVIGPIGTPETKGVAPQPGTQLVVRSQHVADQLNKMMGGGSGPTGPRDKPDPTARPADQPNPVADDAKPKASVWRQGSGTSIHNPKPVSNPPVEPPFSEAEEMIIQSYMDAGKTRPQAEQLVKETRGPENKITVIRPTSPNAGGTTRGRNWKNPGPGKKKP
jgi:hypothetical protein